MLKIWTSAACIAGIALALPAGVSAQSSASADPSNVRRPYRGIFGAPAAADTPQSLDLTASVFGAYDDNIYAALNGRNVVGRDPLLTESGPYAGADAGLVYNFNKIDDRLTFGAFAAGQARYTHHSTDNSIAPNAVLDVHADWRLTRLTTLRLREAASYSSRYDPSLTPVPGEQFGVDIATLDDAAFDIFDLRIARSASTVFLTNQIDKNTSVAVGYLFRTLRVIGNQVQGGRFHDYQSSAGSFQLNHARPLNRYAQVQLGYDLRVSDQHTLTGEPRFMHRITAGVNYSRPLSFSRRTTVSFASGAAIIPPGRSLDGTTTSDETRYRITGNASIAHEIGRTWTAQVSYVRGVRPQDGFAELYFNDAVYANLEGLFTRRLSWTSTARWTSSALSGLTDGRNGHGGQSATAQLTFALNSIFGVYARYVYYSYRYGDAVDLDPRMPQRLDRQGARVGLTTSIPLIR